MKLYLAACSFSLLSGVALGYLNGKQTTLQSFADKCSDHNFVVIEDRQDAQDRHYHCFELREVELEKEPARRAPAPAVI